MVVLSGVGSHASTPSAYVHHDVSQVPCLSAPSRVSLPEASSVSSHGAGSNYPGGMRYEVKWAKRLSAHKCLLRTQGWD